MKLINSDSNRNVFVNIDHIVRIDVEEEHTTEWSVNAVLTNGTARLFKASTAGACREWVRDMFAKELMPTIPNVPGGIEVCPYCGCENEYNLEKPGFVTVCNQCGKEIFLCDKCMNHEDNPTQSCNFHEHNNNGCCKRGICLNN